jgi:hypothetical protein
MTPTLNATAARPITNKPTLKAIVHKTRPRRMGPRYWREVVTGLLNQTGHALSERELSFLANIQQSCRRNVMPSREQQVWIRSIQGVVSGGSYGPQ